MTTRESISLLAAALQLSLAVTALAARGARQTSGLSRPLAGLGFCMFGWNIAVFARDALGAPAVTAFDAAFTAFSPVLVLEVVLAFTGTARAHRRARVALCGSMGALSAVSLTGVAALDVRAWVDGPSWALLFLAGWLPSLAFELVLLVRHLGRSADAREKARTRTVLSALAIGAACAMSDVARALGLRTPWLGAFGTVISGALLTSLVVRMELLDRNVSARMSAYVLAMTTAFVVAYVVVLRSFAGSLVAQTLGTLFVTLFVIAVARELASSRAEARERMQRLTVLGRFSSQMAHDLKSPLTALLGAVQVLEAVPEGDDRDPRAEAEAKAMRSEFLLLIAEQARRVAAIVARYDEIGRVEPRMTVVRVNDVARAVARAFVLPPASLVLAPGEPECEADRDLLEGAVENVVRNAVEACQEAGMSDASGAVRIETAEDDAAGVLRIRIVDQGPGMDARSRARALDDFFTTKATGSGLGLPFVHRVITAHGGEVHLESEGGRGTTVELVLPARGRHAARM